MTAHDEAVRDILMVVNDKLGIEYSGVVRRAIESYDATERFCRNQRVAFELAKRSYAENSGSIPVDFVPFIFDVSLGAVQRAIATKALDTIEEGGCLHVLTVATKMWRSGVDHDGNNV